MMGPGLGGGFGRHGGIYGLISDNIITLNAVLANGTAITVDSTNHPDLLWGMRGAGHNFAVVTSFELKIHPRGPDTWHYHNYIWRGDKLEAVSEAVNAFTTSGENSSTPVNMTTGYGVFQMNSSITAEEPVIWWTFAYRGNAEEAETLLAPFNAIESAYEESGDVPYPVMAVAQKSDESSFECQHDLTRITATTFLKTFNVTTERQIFKTFQQRARENPALAAGAGILHEFYSTQAVLQARASDSAFPWRNDRNLNLVNIAVDPGNQTLQAEAEMWAQDIRDMWLGGQPGVAPHTYVNYASGFESVESIYGYEPWRLDRFKELKRRYDPENAFRYYNPIVGDNEDV